MELRGETNEVLDLVGVDILWHLACSTYDRTCTMNFVHYLGGVFARVLLED
jgi:hypothetical protein